MTLSSSVRKAGPFVGTGTATVFPFTFKVFTKNDLLVIYYDTTLQTSVNLVLDSEYTVSLNTNQDSNPGGTITLPAALESGYTLTITSAIDYLQPTDYTNQGGFYPSVVTISMDRLTIFTQQLAEIVSRCAKVDIASDTTAAELSAAILLLANNYESIISISGQYKTVDRQTMTSDIVFNDLGAYKIYAFLEPSGADYSYIPAGTFADGIELTICNISSDYLVKFQDDIVTPGTKQTYIHDAINGVWI